MTFVPFPKIPRLSREIIITEKIDGTNASVHVVAPTQAVVEKWPTDKAMVGEASYGEIQAFIFAGSRKRFITPADDNFGFAKWVLSNAEDLISGLGYGSHYGEWWGSGIQRGYDLPKGEKRFSLFNTHRWTDDEVRPSCCHVVPVLETCMFDELTDYGHRENTTRIDQVMEELKVGGSLASPGFMRPEGVIIYHTAGNLMFKKTIEGDDARKEYGV